MDHFDTSPAYNHMRVAEWQIHRKSLKNSSNNTVIMTSYNMYDLYASAVLWPQWLSTLGNKLSFPHI